MASIDRRLLTHINWPLLAVMAILFAMGVLNLYSASGFRMGDGVSLNPIIRSNASGARPVWRACWP